MGCCGQKITPNVIKPKQNKAINPSEIKPQPKPKDIWGKS